MQYRKFTRIKNYDYNTNGYYFVTICVNDRRDLFGSIKDGKMVLNDVGKIINDAWQWLGKQYEYVELDQFIIMPNHIHVIICINNSRGRSRTAPTTDGSRTAPADDSRMAPTTKRKPLGRLIGAFKTVSTKQINIMRQTAGKQFWQRNYYEHIIRDEKALYNLRKYISENPLKEKINWDYIYPGRGGSRTAPTDDSRTASTDGSRTAPTRQTSVSQLIPAFHSGAIYRTNKGISLIIAVFAIMLFSVLGWTLVKIQSTDFESNVSTGNLNSERALNLAEAGAEWALQRLNLNGGFRTDTTNGYPLGYAQHSISPGQYRVSCLDGTGDDAGLAIITSTGYIPSAANYNTARQVRLKIQVGSLTKAVMTQVADPDNQNIGLFDWSLAKAGHTVTINGDISAGHYSGDGDANPDEANQDYGTAPILPPGAVGSKRDFTATYPAIDMEWFHDNADQRWPDSDIPVTATIQDIENRNNNEDCIIVTIDTPAFFQNMEDDGAIRLDVANWYNPPGGEDEKQVNWRHIRSVGGRNCCDGFNNRCARVENIIGEPGWDIGNTITLMRRFGSNADDGSPGDIWYIGRQQDGGQTMETIIDVNDGNLSLPNRYIISEGNIYIKGRNDLTMRLSGPGATTRYPRLATKSGDIISPDDPDEDTESKKVEQRVISGLIYGELGEIKLNYLCPQNTGLVAYQGNLVYGEQVTLDGRISINYLPGLVSTNGFTFAPATKSWDEE